MYFFSIVEIVVASSYLCSYLCTCAAINVAALAFFVERMTCDEQVMGSNPVRVIAGARKRIRLQQFPSLKEIHHCGDIASPQQKFSPQIVVYFKLVGFICVVKSLEQNELVNSIRFQYHAICLYSKTGRNALFHH